MGKILKSQGIKHTDQSVLNLYAKDTKAHLPKDSSSECRYRTFSTILLHSNILLHYINILFAL